jgi:hypothetical protein
VTLAYASVIPAQAGIHHGKGRFGALFFCWTAPMRILVAEDDTLLADGVLRALRDSATVLAQTVRFEGTRAGMALPAGGRVTVRVRAREFVIVEVRGQRRRHRRGPARADLRALLPRPGHRRDRLGTGAADRGFGRRPAPRRGAGEAQPRRARQRIHGGDPAPAGGRSGARAARLAARPAARRLI